MRSVSNESEAFAALKQYLVENFDAKVASGGKEVIKRCHFCGDSRDSSSRHLYIGQSSDGAIVYNCFKCNAGGVVDGKFLRDMGCYDQGIIELCQEQNRNSSSSKSGNSGRVKRHSRLPMSKKYQIVSNPGSFTNKKLEYISKRLGYNFTLMDLPRFKIILNLKEFLNFNGFTYYTRHPDLVEQLDKFFIGFLSADGEYVILRRLVPEGKVSKYIDSRYVNYSMYGDKSTREGLKYYILPSLVDMNKQVEIHVAEGVFDIMSIFLNVAPKDVNGIFASVCGKSYGSLLSYIIAYYGVINPIIHLYPDNDVKQYEISRALETIRPFAQEIFIHRNTYEGEKDFGVSPDKIKESIMKG